MSFALVLGAAELLGIISKHLSGCHRVAGHYLEYHMLTKHCLLKTINLNAVKLGNRFCKLFLLV